MKGFLFIILICILSNGCYTLRTFKQYYYIGEAIVVETHFIDGRWEITWVNSNGSEQQTYAADTTTFHKGYSMKTLIKL